MRSTTCSQAYLADDLVERLQILEMAKQKTQRVTLVLGEQASRRLERLQRLLDVRTIVGVIQQALQLLEFFVTKVTQGNEFLVRDKNGNLELITVLGISGAVEDDEQAA